ncbi:ATP-dependent RNA helicase DHX58-like isoform X2 [Antedon mediterranea]|uniref:ATP-dependent RNA helicase DHX58-like isoform X2 n=1 Tax=Antedon mediterranea TaxID=105859 RepID=UPI003AF84394
MAGVDTQLPLLTEVFRPYLIENLKFSTIMADMVSFLDGSVGAVELFGIMTKEREEGAPAAMDAFLDLLEKKSIPGSYSRFINALRNMEDEKVKHIADWIEGINLENLDTIEEQKHIVRAFAPKLQDVQTGLLIPHLQCLGRQDVELLRADVQNKGDCYAAITLMLTITTKQPGWFTELVNALRKVERHELADLLDPPEDHISEILPPNIEENPEVCQETDAPQELQANAEIKPQGNPQDIPQDNPQNNPQEPEEIEEIELREYQKELAQPAIEGHNTVVVAPAGSGKTVVGVFIANDHLNREKGASNGKPKKVAFLVNKVPLVKQQQDQFKKYMASSKVIGVSGEMGSMTMEVKELLKDRDVIVMTAQILVNALNNTDSNQQRLDISDFSMIIMDECHRCQKGDPYNVIMSKYRDMKIDSPDKSRPQIVGLTAGLGVGQAQSSYKAESHILMICGNMDVHKISIVEKNLDELNEHVNIPTEETILVARHQDDKFAEVVNSIMAKIEMIIMESEGWKRLQKLDRNELKCPNTRGTQPYEQWVVKVKDTSAKVLTDNDMRRVIVACTNHLREYNNALFINHAARPKDGLTYLQKFFENENDKLDTFTKTENQLHTFFTAVEEQLQLIVEDPANCNPLLEKLGSTMKDAYNLKPDSCGILFTTTRSSTEALKAWIEESKDLKHLNPGILIGGGGSGGMTQSQQVDLLNMFKEKKHKLIVATSVAEEGIDIQACNLVFRYNYFSNTIGRIQARGRNRAAFGRFFLIASTDSGLGDLEQMNKIREGMMNTATRAIKALEEKDFLEKIAKYQRTDKAERRMREKGKMERKKEHCDVEIKLTCLQCGLVACSNSDIRKIKNAHHAVVSDTMAGRYKKVPNPKKSKRINDLEFLEKVVCVKCGAEWGCMLKYCGHFFPVLTIKAFIVNYGQGKPIGKYKQWSLVPFSVQDFSIEDDIEKQINKESGGSEI